MARRDTTIATAAMRSAHRFLASHVAVTAMLVAGHCAIVGAAHAEDDHFGITEYEIACMPCHGLDGRGDGEMAHSLSVRPADLTQIAKANNGVFPAAKVAEMIDGRTAVAGHMQREMPVWGDRYRKVTEPGESGAVVDERARGQIDALVEYLETIQEK